MSARSWAGDSTLVSWSSSIAAPNGFLIRNHAAFEHARDLDAVIFDKTGTLTDGTFTVTDILNLGEEFSDEEVFKYAVSLETISEQPLAKEILEKAGKTCEQEEFDSITGKGIQGKVNVKNCKSSKPRLYEKSGNGISGKGSGRNIFSRQNSGICDH